MSVLSYYWRYNLALPLANRLDDIELDLRVDNSGFVVVDGEEGDYGVTLYYDSANDLIATVTNHGGDDFDIEYSEKGKALMKERILFELDALLASQ
jgi:regulation of enolase protein 1 (concanavalin A-like superfamily)